MKKWVLVSVLACGLLSACGDKKVACGDETGLTAVKGIVTEAVEKELRSQNSSFSLSAVRAAITKLALSFEDVRTSKNDPNSNKVFCEANLTVSLPAELLADVQKAMEASGETESLEKLLEGFNYTKSAKAANQYQIGLVYNLQPTDDGKTVYAELEDSANAVGGMGKVLDLALSKNALLNQQRENERLAKEAQKAVEQAEQFVPPAQAIPSRVESGEMMQPVEPRSTVEEMQLEDSNISTVQ